MTLLGIDLRAAPSRPSAVAVIDDDSRVVYLGSFTTDVNLLSSLEQHQPEIVAIGAPLTLPSGLCCLELECTCEFANPQRKGRRAELELARMGISCFFTNKRSIIRDQIYRGIKLSRKLHRRKYNVIEVYPYGTKVILFGDKVPPKNSARSLAFMKERLPSLISGLEPHLGKLDRNQCDALVNAYTALLHSRNETDMLGDAEEGLLALPKLPC